ncbi:hypothetical protein STEG23_021453 [Scotinomys teguina]
MFCGFPVGTVKANLSLSFSCKGVYGLDLDRKQMDPPTSNRQSKDSIYGSKRALKNDQNTGLQSKRLKSTPVIDIESKNL